MISVIIIIKITNCFGRRAHGTPLARRISRR